MRGKRNRTTSTSPVYEHVVWLEKKTGRGSRIIGKVTASPQTPKIKKQQDPQSKRRRFEGSQATTKDPDEEGPITVDPIKIKLPQAKKSGKVRWCRPLVHKEPSQ